MKFQDYIESNHTIMLGKPVIKGTRITVELILKKLSEGASISQLIDMYPSLNIEHVNACLAYASDVISNELILQE
ncbi:MAG: DUF433 domain-containing protein [Bacteroidia bacterium]